MRLCHVSALVALDSHISAKDIVLPANVTLVTNPEEIIASIAVPKEEVEEVPMDLSAIEVEKKGKTEEEGAEGEAAPGEAKKEGDKAEKEVKKG